LPVDGEGAATATAPRAHEANVTQSVRKALDVLESLAAAEHPLSAQEVARECGLSRPTAYRLLTTLQARGFAAGGARGAEIRYQLGAALVRLGQRALEALELPGLAKPALRELSRQTGETAHLGVLDGAEGLYLDKVEGSHRVQVRSPLGRRGPLHCTSLGKAILAHLPVEERDALLARLELPRRTPRTITDRAVLAKHLAEVRARGYALDEVENEEGVLCVGAPIFDHTGRVFAAVSVSGPDFRLSGRIAELAGHVARAARAVSRELGYQPESPERRE
jgi:IclR family acetate operon transcriptional repressor